MNVDWILSTAIKAIKQQLPEAIYSGFLVNKQQEFDPTSNQVISNPVNQPVEIILDTLTQEEIQASGLLATDLKLYIIGDKSYDISFDKRIQYLSKEYRVKRVVESIVGSKIALWTIICRK